MREVGAAVRPVLLRGDFAWDYWAAALPCRAARSDPHAAPVGWDVHVRGLLVPRLTDWLGVRSHAEERPEGFPLVMI